MATNMLLKNALATEPSRRFRYFAATEPSIAVEYFGPVCRKCDELLTKQYVKIRYSKKAQWFCTE